jgi:glycosyltransferase involved in cell wall biosynthesis
VLTPYWVHMLVRFARELPGVQLATCSLFEQGDQPWTLEEVREINLTRAGHGEGVGKGWLATLRRDWSKGGRVIRWIEESGAKAVVIGGYADACRARVIRWCHRRGVPVLMLTDSNIRSARPSGVRGAVKRWLFKELREWLDAVLVCGRNGADYFSSYGFEHGRIFVCPVEPDYRLIQELPAAEVAPVLAKYGLPLERKRLVTCSRHIQIKRVDMAIDAFAAIAGERPDWDLVVVGSGPLHDAHRARVPDHLRSRVVFTGFIGHQREISAIYRGSHVLVHSADFEPFGLVLPEAVAAGMAVVCSTIVGSAPEVVAEGVNGRVFPVGNLRLLIEALRDVTDAARLEGYRARSPGVLADWRRRGDPVRGLRQALSTVGVGVEQEPAVDQSPPAGAGVQPSGAAG